MTRYEFIGQYKPVADIDPQILEIMLWSMDDFAKQIGIGVLGDIANIPVDKVEELYDDFRKNQNV